MCVWIDNNDLKYRRNCWIFTFSSLSDIASGSWTETGKLRVGRSNYAHGVITLSDGRTVFIASGGKAEAADSPGVNIMPCFGISKSFILLHAINGN